MGKITSSETSQTERILRLIHLLREPKYSVLGLAKICKVGRQTIYRDFNVLENVGYFIDQKEKKYFIFEINPKTVFTEEETYLIQESISLLSDNSPLKVSIQKKLSSTSYIFPQSDELKDKHLGMIIQKLRVAIKEGYQIRLINYHSLNSDMIKNRLIIPLKLSSDFAMLSAVEEGKEKTFKIKRMTDVEILYEEKAGIGEAMNVDIFGCSSTEALPIQLYLSKRAFQLFYEEYPSARMYLNKRKNFTVFPYELRLEVQNYAGIGRWCLGLIGELKVVGDEGFRVYLNEKLKAGGEY